jgi:mono/diheme cytochrome c family protein
MGARDHIVRQILRGNAEKGMPAFAATLSDHQVAAVATYIRNAWDNVHGVVLEGDVKKVRDEGKAD